MSDKRTNIDKAVLRAYLDNALSVTDTTRVEHYLANSADARAVLDQIRREIDYVEQAMETLSPSGVTTSSATTAFNQLQSQLAQNTPFDENRSFIERINSMFLISFFKRHQFATIATTIALVLFIALSFAPVRAFAGGLLSVFRVQQVQVIPIDAQRMEDLKNNEEFSSLMEQFSPEERIIVDGGEPQTVASIAEAASMVDFSVAEISAVPADAGAQRDISVMQKSVQEMDIDPDLAEAIFEAAGINVDLPDSLRDTPIRITRPTMIMQAWGDEDGLHFGQMRSPEIEYPDDLNLNELGASGLQVLGYSQTEAETLAANIDWANTLLLPAPTDGDMVVTEISINGVDGTIIEHVKEDKHGTMLMWQRDGITYLLNGPYNADQLAEIAQSVQ